MLFCRSRPGPRRISQLTDSDGSVLKRPEQQRLKRADAAPLQHSSLRRRRLPRTGPGLEQPRILHHCPQQAQFPDLPLPVPRPFEQMFLCFHVRRDLLRPLPADNPKRKRAVRCVPDRPSTVLGLPTVNFCSLSCISFPIASTLVELVVRSKLQQLPTPHIAEIQRFLGQVPLKSKPYTKALSVPQVFQNLYI